MQLTLWTYEGPPHVGAMRVATAMQGVHYVLHAPQGDTYADLLFTMIERRNARPPVTYTTFQARDLGADTAELFKTAARDAYERFQPRGDAGRRVLHGRTDPGRSGRPRARARPADPGRSARACRPTRRRKTGARRRPSISWCGACAAPGAARARHGAAACRRRAATCSAPRRSASAIATTSPRSRDLLDRHRHRGQRRRAARRDARRSRATRRCRFQRRPLSRDRRHRRAAGFSASSASPARRPCRSASARRATSSPRSRRSPDRRSIAHAARADGSRLPWYSRSVDSTYLTGKRVFVFGDATHAIAAARIAAEELGFKVVGLGTYSREFAREVREAAHELRRRSADHRRLSRGRGAQSRRCSPNWCSARRWNATSPSASAFPARSFRHRCMSRTSRRATRRRWASRAPTCIFDTWVHPLMMGLEEHLLGMFRDDFEFDDGVPCTSRLAAAFDHRASASATAAQPRRYVAAVVADRSATPAGRTDAERELARFRSSCAARRAATPRATPRSVAWPSSPSRPCTMQKHISHAERDAGARRHRDAGQPRRRHRGPRRSHAAPRAAWARACGPRGRRVGHGRRGARALPRGHRPRRHHHRDDDVPGRPHPCRAAGARGATRPLRRDAVLHVRGRGRAAHAPRPLRHVRRSDGPARAAQAAARQALAPAAARAAPAR